MKVKKLWIIFVLVWGGFVMADVKNAPLLANLDVTSVEFKAGEAIPTHYACNAVSPHIAWSQVPAETKSIVIICDDSDAVPLFTHWVIFNIPPMVKELQRGATVKGAIVARNSKNQNAFFGPCPPAGRVHHYHFKVYALDTVLKLTAAATRAEVERALKDHVLATGELVGTYENQS